MFNNVSLCVCIRVAADVCILRRSLCRDAVCVRYVGRIDMIDPQNVVGNISGIEIVSRLLALVGTRNHFWHTGHLNKSLKCHVID